MLGELRRLTRLIGAIVLPARRTLKEQDFKGLTENAVYERFSKFVKQRR